MLLYSSNESLLSFNTIEVQLRGSTEISENTCPRAAEDSCDRVMGSSTPSHALLGAEPGWGLDW